MTVTDTYLVYPNPWGVSPAALAAKDPLRATNPTDTTFDSDGIPCGVLQNESKPTEHIGARICRKSSVVADYSAWGKEYGDMMRKGGDSLLQPLQTTVWEFCGVNAEDPGFAAKLAGAEPVRVPATRYYRAALQAADILPADAATSKAASVRHAFEEPKSLFPKLEALALRAFQLGNSSAFDSSQALMSHRRDKRHSRFEARNPKSEPAANSRAQEEQAARARAETEARENAAREAAMHAASESSDPKGKGEKGTK